MKTFTDWMVSQAKRDDNIGDIAREVTRILGENPQFASHGAGHWLAILWHEGHSLEQRVILEDAIDEYNLMKFGFSKKKQRA